LGKSCLALGATYILLDAGRIVPGLCVLFGLAHLAVVRQILVGNKRGCHGAMVLCVIDAVAFSLYGTPIMLASLNALLSVLCLASLLTRGARDWFHFVQQVRQELKARPVRLKRQSPSSGVC
jgi:hypothetical protein